MTFPCSRYSIIYERVAYVQQSKNYNNKVSIYGNELFFLIWAAFCFSLTVGKQMGEARR
jgi:hypothetical protein